MQLAVLNLADAVCNTTDAHCEYCRSANGPKLWAQWAKVYEFEADAEGRPACPKQRAMGWNRPAATTTTARSPRRHRLKVVMPWAEVEARRALCAVCEHRIGADCGKVAEKRPHAANIEAGTARMDVRCPIGRFERYPALPATVGGE